jgi:hypothetical protein
MAKLLPVKKLLLLAALCLVAYAPALNLPLIEDDYPNIAQALDFPSPVAPLLNPIFRTRATSYWAMKSLYGAFHMSPNAYHSFSLALHIFNTWLLYFALRQWRQTRAAALWAAGFFAVHEGHQEAVMWFSAINELLQFLFGGLALLLWMRGRRWIAPSLLCFALALISKESAVVFVALFVFAWFGRPQTLPRWSLLPYAIFAAIAVASVVMTQSYSFRFSDGSFSWHAPFWVTLPRGFFRLMWIWGWIAAAILAWRARAAFTHGAALAAIIWIAVALLPYSFLTYSTQIPSRQTYLASAGLALLFGLMASHLYEQGGGFRSAAIVLAIAALLHNVGYIWYRKRPQFLTRAQPTEQLIHAVRETGAPVWVQCFPLARITAEAAVRLETGLSPQDLLWTEAEAHQRPPKTVLCYMDVHRAQ